MICHAFDIVQQSGYLHSNVWKDSLNNLITQPVPKELSWV
jgi:hypothetical protein